MFSKPTERRSISSQLVLLFTLAAALLLSCGLGAFYGMAVRQAFGEDNAVFADKIRALRAEIHNPEGLRALQEQVLTMQPGEAAVYWVRLLDAERRVLAETPGMDASLPAALFPGSPATEGGVAWRPRDLRRNGRLFSLVSTTERVERRLLTLQVAQDRSGDDAFAKRFGALLALVLTLGIVAAAVIAMNVTRRGLRPLTEMTESLGRIGPTQLAERLRSTRWPAELQPMAAAFDGMLDRLEDSFTRLSQFSADIAHELRTPVANILGEAEVSLTRERSALEYREVLESCVAECTRLSVIIDNLLFLARAESADRQIRPTSFAGREAIEKIAAYYGTAAEERRITIRCEGEAQICADPVLFGRAISNLVENALRFTPDGGAIRIRLGILGKDAQVRVEDTGTGIPARHIPHVFDRFYRVDSARPAGGSGLGLALVKSISELHGGSVSIESEENRGTTVVLTFPC